MPLDALANYAGPPLPPRIQFFLSLLERHSLTIAITGPSKKTIRVFDGNRNLGYVNGTVIQRDGLLGYHFLGPSHSSDSCPRHLEPTLVADFCARYGCNPSALDPHEGAGSNAGRLFLLLRDPAVALRVLQIDSGATPDQDILIAEVAKRFVEGKVVDVLMQRRERDPAARAACVAEYGFVCFACGVNLKQRYVGLQVEVVHVHHEEPLSLAAGEREFDPVATMKPLCPNCHCVVHSRNPPYTIAEVRGMVTSET
jgi:hypothetical protein